MAMAAVSDKKVKVESALQAQREGASKAQADEEENLGAKLKRLKERIAQVRADLGGVWRGVVWRCGGVVEVWCGAVALRELFADAPPQVQKKRQACTYGLNDLRLNIKQLRKDTDLLLKEQTRSMAIRSKRF